MTTDTPTKQSGMSPALIAGVWAIVGAVCATGTWAVLNGIYGAVEGASLIWFGPAFITGVYFGGFLALLFLLPYWGLLLGYLALRARRPSIERSANQLLLAAFCLALPAAVVVFVSFLDPWSPLGPFWDEALVAGLMALASIWSGIVVPRFLVPLLPRPSWVAA